MFPSSGRLQIALTGEQLADPEPQLAPQDYKSSRAAALEAADTVPKKSKGVLKDHLRWQAFASCYGIVHLFQGRKRVGFLWQPHKNPDREAGHRNLWKKFC